MIDEATRVARQRSADIAFDAAKKAKAAAKEAKRARRDFYDAVEAFNMSFYLGLRAAVDADYRFREEVSAAAGKRIQAVVLSPSLARVIESTSRARIASDAAEKAAKAAWKLDAGRAGQAAWNAHCLASNAFNQGREIITHYGPRR
jgi:hypothetical protein